MKQERKVRPGVMVNWGIPDYFNEYIKDLTIHKLQVIVIVRFPKSLKIISQVTLSLLPKEKRNLVKLSMCCFSPAIAKLTLNVRVESKLIKLYYSPRGHTSLDSQENLLLTSDK